MRSNIKLIIKDIDYGIAFRIKDTIYLNKNLKKYPKLRKALIKHEREHTNKLTKKDIWIDLTGKHLSNVKKQYYLFILREKRAWYQFLPILKVGGKLSIDILMTLFWAAIIIGGIIIFKIL
jgi:hypothetical protein